MGNDQSKILRRNNINGGSEERIRSLTSSLSFALASRKSTIGSDEINALKRMTSRKSTMRNSRVSLFENIQRKKYLEFKDSDDFKIIVSILQKYPKYRTEHETMLLKEAFADVKYFETLKNELDAESIDKLVREMGYEYSRKNDEVFKIGDLGRKFYVILQGKVDVLLKKEGMEDAQDIDPEMKKSISNQAHGLDMPHPIFEENQEEEEPSSATIHPKMRSASSPLRKPAFRNSEAHPKKKMTRISMFPTQQTPEEEREEYYKQTYPHFFRARTLVAGDSFGEVALRQNIARTATIVCIEECHFAILTKDSFQKILAFHYDAISNENLHFLKSVSIFRKWALGNLEQLFYQMETREYFYGSVLFKEDDESTHFYFIKEGDFEISTLIQEEVEDAHAIKISRNGLYLPELQKKKKRVKLAKVGRSAIVGYLEILEKTRRKTMAMCVTAHGRALVMQKNKFFAFVRNEMSINVLQKLESNYSSHFESLLENAKIIQEEVIFSEGPPHKAKLKKKQVAEQGSEVVGQLQSHDETRAPYKEDRLSSGTKIKAYENPLYKLSHKDKLNDEFASNYEVLKSICHDKILHSDKPDLNSHSLIYDMEIPKKYQANLGGKHSFYQSKLERKTSLGNAFEDFSPRVNRLYKRLETTEKSIRREDILNTSLVESNNYGIKSDRENIKLETAGNNLSNHKSNREEVHDNLLPLLIKTNPAASLGKNIHMEKHRRAKTLEGLTKKENLHFKKVSKLARDLQTYISVKNIHG